MRILFIAYDISSRIGGIQRFNQRVLRCLGDLQQSAKVSCTILSFRDAPFVVHGGPQQLRIHGFRRRKPAAMVSVLAHLLCHRYDLLLLDHVVLSPLAGIARMCRAPRARIMMFAHGVDVWDDPAYHCATRLQKACCRHYLDRIVAVSNYTARRMQKAFGISSGRFGILPNAIDLDGCFGAPPPLRPRHSARIITVSRLDEREKGIDQVIRALPAVISAIPDTEYLIVGDGILRRELEQLAGTCGVAAHVRFVGRVTDDHLAELYRSSSVFVMPSLQEGFGIVYLEAWKHALPVIAGNRDAAVEVVDDGINGLTVDPTSPDAIARAIIDLLRRPDNARRLGLAGYAKLFQRYHHASFHAQFERILLSSSLTPDTCSLV